MRLMITLRSGLRSTMLCDVFCHSLLRYVAEHVWVYRRMTSHLLGCVCAAMATSGS